MRPSTFGEALLMPRTCSNTAWESPGVSVLVPRLPMRTPLRARLPASTQIKLSPTLLSWSSTRLEPALPTATTQINDPTPMMMPSMVSRLRTRLRTRACKASRNMVLNDICSLVAWRFNRVQTRRLLRWIITKENADGHGHGRSTGNGAAGDKNRPARGGGDHQRCANANADPHDASGQAHDNGLGQELPLNVTLSGANGHANTDFASALGDRDQHDVHDPDSAHQQR